MKTTHMMTLLLLMLFGATSHAQATIRQTEKPSFTPEQSKAIDALYEQGGIIIQLAEDQPGKPVILIDYGGHPDFQDSWIDHALVFTELKALRFNDTAISDAGVARLGTLKKLEKLELKRTHVSEAAVTALKKSLPNLQVTLSPPELSPEAALAEIKKVGGLLVHYDERGPVRPGPVIMIDCTNRQDFKDEWTKYFVGLPKLAQIGLGGTALSDAGMAALAEVPELKALHLDGTRITDQGLAKLANSKKLEYVGLEKTAVTPAGIAALRQALPQVEINVEPEKLKSVNPFPGGRPVVPFVERTPPPRPESPVAESAGPAVKQFTAAEIATMREKMTALGELPANTPNGWSKSKIDPTKLLTVTPAIKVKAGYVLRAYVFKDKGNSNGFVWALPADAEFPEAKDCPVLDSHFLKAPKPLDALDDVMEAIDGDNSLESYLQATLLRRELREFASGWHGVVWGFSTILDDDPWKKTAKPDAANDPSRSPQSKANEWKWIGAKPEQWNPEVRREANQVTVTFYSYTPLAAESKTDQEEIKERIIRHTETYRAGKYRPLITEKIIATGPQAVAP